jgi:hypothetical protein
VEGEVKLLAYKVGLYGLAKDIHSSITIRNVALERKTWKSACQERILIAFS